MCEIDSDVVEASKAFLPKLSCAFSHPKAELKIGDGLAFAEAAADATYDVIVVDSSDPVGPAEKLFSMEFYTNIHRILKPGGVICSQGESLWINDDLIATMVSDFGAPFESAEYASIQVPTYPSGQIGAFIARKAVGDGSDHSCRNPRRPVPENMELRYYSPDMHAAAFAIPAFMDHRLAALKATVPADKRPRCTWSAP
ncbi:unnamed protein product [Polarella glacialis]|uniref:PABS domain-containing protein n=2 Tax=Polarella glacialis TaxID=89957 RepID=A0A813DFY3_POLGL|nr:unnamed protein product [Polarella glacialis]